MKKNLLTVFFCFFIIHLFAQNKCNYNHPLFVVHNYAHLFIIKKLGNGDEFYPLHCLKTNEQVLDNLKNPTLWNKYPKELKEMDVLLNIIGFTNGVNSRELTQVSITTAIIPFNSEGNLGGTHKTRTGKRTIRYHYSRLEIAGYQKGIPAWKITSPTGCYFYVLRRCGNAFYLKDCCNTVKLSVITDTLEIKPHYFQKTINFTVCKYKITHCITHGHSKKGKVIINDRGDTSKQAECKDYSISIDVPEGNSYQVYFDPKGDTIRVCTDTTIIYHGRLRLRGLGEGLAIIKPDEKPIFRIYYDAYVSCDTGCNKKWEVGVNGGFAYNTVPAIADNNIHSKASNAHFAGDIYLSYIFNQNLQAGIDIGDMTLEYKDDAPYPRTASSSAPYSNFYLGKPVIPVQLFGKLTFTSGGFIPYISLAAGYAIVTNDQIKNSDVILSTKPGIGNGFVGSVGIGADYFWNCHWGIGASVKASYFSLNGTAQRYNLFAFPATAGIRYRWK